MFETYDEYCDFYESVDEDDFGDRADIAYEEQRDREL